MRGKLGQTGRNQTGQVLGGGSGRHLFLLKAMERIPRKPWLSQARKSLHVCLEGMWEYQVILVLLVTKPKFSIYKPHERLELFSAVSTHSNFFFRFFFSPAFFFFFSVPDLWHMEAPMPGVKLELTAAGLCYSHSNAGSELHLWPIPQPQLSAKPDP